MQLVPALLLLALPPSDWSPLPITGEARVDAVAVSGVDAAHVFLWTGIAYRSTDGGES
ncbi:MAG: hypothetical protein R3B81_16310 [bacterium]